MSLSEVPVQSGVWENIFRSAEIARQKIRKSADTEAEVVAIEKVLDEFEEDLKKVELRLKKVEESMLPMTPQTDGASRSQEGGRQASTGMKTRVQVCRNV